MRVLLTGAAGKVGSAILARLAGRYDWVLTDLRPPRETYGLPFVRADLADLDALRVLCRRAEAVVHLGATANEKAGWQELLQPNIVGAYHLFEAAAEAGCRRVVFASSLHAVGGYGREEQLRAHAAPRPLDLYGATKAWGEALAALYAYQRSLSVICLRLGWVVERDDRSLWSGTSFPGAVLTHEDLTRLVCAALDAPAEMRFGIFPCVSHPRGPGAGEEALEEFLRDRPRHDEPASASRSGTAPGGTWLSRMRGRWRSLLRRGGGRLPAENRRPG